MKVRIADTSGGYATAPAAGRKWACRQVGVLLGHPHANRAPSKPQPLSGGPPEVNASGTGHLSPASATVGRGSHFLPSPDPDDAFTDVDRDAASSDIRCRHAATLARHSSPALTVSCQRQPKIDQLSATWVLVMVATWTGLRRLAVPH